MTQKRDADSDLSKDESHAFKRPRILREPSIKVNNKGDANEIEFKVNESRNSSAMSQKTSLNPENILSCSESVEGETIDPLPDMIRSETESIPPFSKVRQTSSESSKDLFQNGSGILINNLTSDQETLDLYHSENDCVTVNSNLYKNDRQNLDAYSQVATACEKMTTPTIKDETKPIKDKFHNKIESAFNEDVKIDAIRTFKNGHPSSINDNIIINKSNEFMESNENNMININCSNESNGSFSTSETETIREDSEINFGNFEDESSQTESWISEASESVSTDDDSDAADIEDEHRRLIEGYEYGFPHLYTYLQSESCKKKPYDQFDPCIACK